MNRDDRPADDQAATRHTPRTRCRPLRRVAGLLALSAWAAALIGCGSAPVLPPAPVVLDEAGLHLPDVRLPVSLPEGHRELALSPDGQRLAMVHADERGRSGGLVLLDVTTPAADSAHVALSGAPADLAWLPDGRLAVLLAEPAEVLLLDGHSGALLSRHATGSAIASRLALSDDGAAAWISHAAPGSVSRIDLAGGVRSVVSTDPGADGLAMRPGSDELWVAHRTAGSLAVVDVDTRSLIARIPCPGFPVRVSFTPDGERALVSCALSGELALFDTDERSLLGRVPLGIAPVAGAGAALAEHDASTPWPAGTSMPRGPLPVDVLAVDDRLAWVGCAGGEALALVDVRTLELIGVRPTSGAPDALAPRPPRPEPTPASNDPSSRP